MIQFSRSRAEVHRQAVQVLREHLKLKDCGRTCPVPVFLGVVLAACARLTSLFQAVRGLARVPSMETIRKALHRHLPKMALLEDRLNAAFQATRPRSRAERRANRRGVRLAVDLTLIPYHGQPHRQANELYRGQPKDGTTHFHAYATACLLDGGRHVTVALVAVPHGLTAKQILQNLLARIDAGGWTIRLILLDRGFYSTDVFQLLKDRRLAFVMPVPTNGRPATHPKGPGGTRIFQIWTTSGTTTYELVTKNPKRSVRIRIVVHRRNRAGRRGRQGRENLVYAVGGFRPPTPAQISTLYRRRFTIESSYRQMNQARIRTCSRCPRVRLFLMGVALILRNLWIQNWDDPAVPHQTPPSDCRFKHFLLTLFLAVLALYGEPPERADRQNHVQIKT